MGFSETSLQEHVTVEHPDSSAEVVCGANRWMADLSTENKTVYLEINSQIEQITSGYFISRAYKLKNYSEKYLTFFITFPTT